MPPRVSVLVPPAAAASRALLTSLDRQTLPATEFETLIGDDGSAPDLTRRLEDLAAHRTNVVLVTVPPDASAEQVADALLARAGGTYVVALPPGRTLTPSTLKRLVAHMDATGADVCAGLTGRAGVRPERLPDPDGLLPGPAGRLHRRAVVGPGHLVGDLTGEASAGEVPVLRSALCFLDGAAPAESVPPEPTGGVRVRVVSAAWRDGVLEIVADASSPAAAARASLYSHTTGVEWPVDDLTVEERSDGVGLTVRIDTESVSGPGRLPDGVWWPTIRFADTADSAVLLRAGPRVAHGATLRRRTVVSFSEAGRLGLDVGGSSHQPVRRLDPAATRVVEDSRGSLMTSALTNIDVAPGARVDGELHLAKMPVVAWIEQVGGTGPALRAWVSGLAGASSLHTRFTRAPAASTGAVLVIDGVGAMTLAPAPKKTSAPTEAAAATIEPAAGAEPTAATGNGDVAAGTGAAKARRLAGEALRRLRR